MQKISIDAIENEAKNWIALSPILKIKCHASHDFVFSFKTFLVDCARL